MRSLVCRLKAFIPQRSPLRLGWHRAKAFFAALRYGFPARKLTVISVTGTDGKTTTVGMVTHILLQAGRNAGAASTAFFQIGRRREENETHLTSISPFTLQRFLRRLVAERCGYAVLEVSSHGLVQGRVNYTFPAVAAVTNTSPEHLDYHGTMERYIADKGKLFRMLDGRGIKVLNGADGSYGAYGEIPSEKTVVYGVEWGDFWLSDIEENAFSTKARLHAVRRMSEGDERTFDLRLSIPGAFNLENALCAIACAVSVGVPIADCVRAIETYAGASGRLERIDEGQDFLVFVDFAVTPQAYGKTLRALRQMVGERPFDSAHGRGRVLVLCSSCGNRMREKRPEVGRVCSALADVVVVSEDETYGEDPHAVLEEVWSGVLRERTEAYRIFDRREGIEFLLRAARPGDAAVICGMGPFTTMTKLHGRVPWDEREIVREILRNRGRGEGSPRRGGLPTGRQASRGCRLPCASRPPIISERDGDHHRRVR